MGEGECLFGKGVKGKGCFLRKVGKALGILYLVGSLSIGGSFYVMGVCLEL